VGDFREVTAMTDKHDTGGPAAPMTIIRDAEMKRVGEDHDTIHYEMHGQESMTIPGMTLLDWFAGQVAAQIQNSDLSLRSDSIAEQSYLVAAALVAEKRRREGE
jgi:hypothetical protein